VSRPALAVLCIGLGVLVGVPLCAPLAVWLYERAQRRG
jgi:hypothetical protein